mmetsp:Transcript_19296/g.45656  ORF Transcript_19296/g.45656 Transcript_19296/m.45656 type:complete len:489 (-) Transcript_19296:2106-3572(-)
MAAPHGGQLPPAANARPGDGNGGAADVFAVKAVLKADGPHRHVGALPGLGDAPVGHRGDRQHAAARGDHRGGLHDAPGHGAVVQHALQSRSSGSGGQRQGDPGVIHRLGASVENRHPRHDCSPLQARDKVTLLVRPWVTAARHDDCDCARVLRDLERLVGIQLALGAGAEQMVEVTVDERQHHLGFGIAKAAVELDDFGPVLSNHQAGKEAADKWLALCPEAVDRWNEDLLPDLLQHLLLHNRRRREGTHATCVGAAVAIEDSLVVLGGRQHRNTLAIAKRQNGTLGPKHPLFQDNLGTCVAKLLCFQALAHGGLGLFGSLRDNHTLASSEAASLDDNIEGNRVDVLQRGFHAPILCGEGLILGRWDVVALHEVLGEGFGRFDLCGRLAWPEDGDVLRPQLVSQTIGEHLLRADHNQANVVLTAEGDDFLELRGRDGHVHVDHRRRVEGLSLSVGVADATISRAHEDNTDLWALAQLPGKCVLPGTRA